MKNIISEINAHLVKGASPCNSTGSLDDVHDGNLVGGGVGKLNGVTVGWWVWEKDGKHCIRAIIPSHTSAEYHTDSAAAVSSAIAVALKDLGESFILPNERAQAPLPAGASVDHGVGVVVRQNHRS